MPATVSHATKIDTGRRRCLDGAAEGTLKQLDMAGGPKQRSDEKPLSAMATSYFSD